MTTKGTSKILFYSIFYSCSYFVTVIFDSDYTIKETYYAMMFWGEMPISLFVIAGLINLKQEERDSIIKKLPDRLRICILRNLEKLKLFGKMFQ